MATSARAHFPLHVSLLPILVLRRDDSGADLLDALADNPRVTLLHVDGLGGSWLPLRSTVACAVTIVQRDPLNALGYAVTAGVRCPIVIGCVRTTPRERAATVRAGAAACLTLPLSNADADAVVTLCGLRSAATDRTRPLLYLDPVHLRAYQGSRHLVLTRREFALLHALHDRDCPVAAADLLLEVWGELIESRQNLEFYIHQLRRKLMRAGLPVTIRTVRGFGYALEAQTSLPSISTVSEAATAALKAFRPRVAK